ncbi:hypothetical protein XaplCFBP3123_10380 [Xanthomonas arboricola pv. populi]|nr:hypothetical protein XaplCFBP3123_10380 [Xanthomonas arboricola pv. populi]
MPRKRLQGRTCSVSRDGGRARALQPSGRSPCSEGPDHPLCTRPARRRFQPLRIHIWRVPSARTPHHRVPASNHSRKRRLSNGQSNSRPSASRNTGTRSP